MLYSAVYSSPLGNIIIAGEGDTVVGVWFEGQRYFMGSGSAGVGSVRVGSAGAVSGVPILRGELPVLQQARGWLDRYFAGEKPSPAELSLAPAGTAFQQIVWRYLLKIPYGETTTYGEIAKKVAADLGKGAMSAQAVGGAVSRNPISIIIPCHRVMGADGSLTGYAGGLQKKAALLTLEGVKSPEIH